MKMRQWDEVEGANTYAKIDFINLNKLMMNYNKVCNKFPKTSKL